MYILNVPGLPATTIVLNDQQIYWSSARSPGVFAVNHSTPDILIEISATAMTFSLDLLSPDQQRIPCELLITQATAITNW